MSRLSTYRWLPGRAGASSPIAISQTVLMRLQLALVIAGLRLFFLFTSNGESRDGVRA